ncbi:MAG: four helix bundle protein [Candidatus Margulisiibacteriota bacterium]
MRDYKKIKAWQTAHELVKATYKATEKYPKMEQFGLTSQLRRAIVSVPANIAEGAVRKTKKEYLQFLYIALGSFELEYIDKNKHEHLDEMQSKAAATLYKLISVVNTEINNERK